jgi:hypothetical protein
MGRGAFRAIELWGLSLESKRICPDGRQSELFHGHSGLQETEVSEWTGMQAGELLVEV